MLLVVFAVYTATCLAGSRAVTDATFNDEVKRTYDPVVVEFQASYCPACRKVAPVYEQLAGEYDGRVKFLTMDTQANSETPEKYNVDRIPTFIYFKDGYEVARATGSMSKEALKGRLGLP